MGSTTFGYPYPDPSDAIADLADKIADLATAIDDQIGLVKTGQEAMNLVNVNTDYSVAVVFAVAYPVGVTPRVTACITNKSTPAAYEPVLISSVSRTGFTINARRSAGGANTNVDWIAVGQ